MVCKLAEEHCHKQIDVVRCNRNIREKKEADGEGGGGGGQEGGKGAVLEKS